MWAWHRLFAGIRGVPIIGVQVRGHGGPTFGAFASRRLVACALVSFFALVGATAQEAGSVTAQHARIPVVGILANGGPDPLIDAVKHVFAEAGYVEGQNVDIEVGFAYGDAGRLPALAAELAERKADVIVSLGAIGVVAARRTAPQVPVVFAGVIDPVAAGFTTTLEHPDRNVTGVTTFDAQQPAQEMQLLRKIVPHLTHIAILSDEDIPRVDGISPLENANVLAARDVGLSTLLLKVHGPAPDLDGAFAAMKTDGTEALVVLDVPATINNQRRIAELALSLRLPTLFLGGRRMADAGGLMAYGTGLLDTLPRLPPLVAKLVGGARPFDVPFETVTQKVLIFNLRTADALRLRIAPELLAQADRIIR
jgi:putative ABC transport system substrate-binding protein